MISAEGPSSSIKSACIELAPFRLVGSITVALRVLFLIVFIVVGLTFPITKTTHASNDVEFAYSLSHDIRVATGAWDVYVNRKRMECFAYTEYKDQNGSVSSFWIGKNSIRRAGFLAVGNETWSYLNIGDSHEVKMRFFDKKGGVSTQWTGSGEAQLFFRLPVLNLKEVPESLIDDVANAFHVEFSIENGQRSHRFSLKGTKKIIGKVVECNGMLAEGELQIDYTSFGATQRNIDVGLASQLGMDNTLGVILENIDPASPAGRAGFRAFDVVIEMSGRKIPNLDFFAQVRSAVKPGQCVEFKILRDGQQRVIYVVFGDFREPQRYLQAGPLNSCDEEVRKKSTSGEFE